MACQVGMTTNPTERERYWRNRVTGLTPESSRPLTLASCSKRRWRLGRA